MQTSGGLSTGTVSETEVSWSLRYLFLVEIVDLVLQLFPEMVHLLAVQLGLFIAGCDGPGVVVGEWLAPAELSVHGLGILDVIAEGEEVEEDGYDAVT